MTRRTFAVGGLAAARGLQLAAQTRAADDELRRVISPSDLTYVKPAPRSEAGIPIGTGRMGTLVWTTPSQLRMQINRVDVYGNNCASNSFFERNQDYCGGCAYVDIECGEEIFPEAELRQHLSVYDGMLEIEGRGAKARAGRQDAGALGRASEALHLALLQTPASVIHLFPAWPKGWDADFRLLAKGNFVIRAGLRGGRVTSAEIESGSGAECHLRNPWGDARVELRREGKTETLQGKALIFATRKGEKVTLQAHA